MVADPPAVPPTTTPEVDPTVATVISLLLHKPPVVASVKVVVSPPQRLLAPDIADNALTVSERVARHPAPTV